MTLQDWLEALKGRASNGVYDMVNGDAVRNGAYMRFCTINSLYSGVTAILTRDINEDFSRCLHLSLSFMDPKTLEPRTPNPDYVETAIDIVFGKNAPWVWVEAPISQLGQKFGVHHYRLFYMDDDFSRPVPMPDQKLYPGWTPWPDYLASFQVQA